MARILIIGGGRRGLRLTERLTNEDHAVRVTTRFTSHRALVEQAGAECWIGDPDRLGSFREALANVAVACWFLATATGEPEQLQALHTSRLEFFLGQQIIDTTVRGFIYEAISPSDRAEIATRLTSMNSIPLRVLEIDPRDEDLWVNKAHEAVCSLLG